MPGGGGDLGQAAWVGVTVWSRGFELAWLRLLPSLSVWLA